MEDRTSNPAGKMNPAIQDIEQARSLARSLEDREARRAGSVELARPIVARRLGINPSKLETLRRGRLKKIEGWLRDRIAALVVREIRNEITRLNNELALARQIGMDPRAVDLTEIETDLARLKALMRPTLVNSEND
jgi:hypothetical protein